MNPHSSALDETLLKRLDRWNESGKWLPEQDQWFPGSAFWGIFAWNYFILLFAIGAIGTMMYRSDPDPSGIGFFTPLNWVIELGIGTFGLATVIDIIGCLWIRRAWNKRVRWLRKGDSLEVNST